MQNRGAQKPQWATDRGQAYGQSVDLSGHKNKTATEGSWATGWKWAASDERTPKRREPVVKTGQTSQKQAGLLSCIEMGRM